MPVCFVHRVSIEQFFYVFVSYALTGRLMKEHFTNITKALENPVDMVDSVEKTLTAVCFWARLCITAEPVV